MEPLTASLSYMGGSGGAGAAGAAMSNPITAALVAAAVATAYGTSPKFRKGTNKVVKKGWEGVTNPFQHFGDGSEKDRFGNMLNGSVLGQGNPEQGGSPINKILSQISQQKRQQQNQQQQPQQTNVEVMGGPYPIDVGYFPVPQARPMIEYPFANSPQIQRRPLYEFS